jgi:hypothetical protein
VPAVFAFLIGIAAGDVPASVQPLAPLMEEVEPDLAPVFNAAPSDRRDRERDRVVDDETVGALHPGSMGTVTVERRIIIRIPMLRVPMVDMPGLAPRVSSPPTRRQPACLPLRAIKGASIHDRAGILFVTTTDSRYQAVLERGCRPVDFQSGFYLAPSPDGAICAGRDMLHARSGLRCTIVNLTRLSPGM